MLSEDTLRQLIHDNSSARQREAEAQRVALRARAARAFPSKRPALVVILGHALAARKHALP